MSNGLKNIQSHARSHSRRERLEAGQAITSCDDDSGISGIGLTPVDDEHPYSNSETSSSGSASHSVGSRSGGGGANTNGGAPHAAVYPTAMGTQGTYQSYAYGPTSSGAHHGYTSSVSSTGTVGYSSASQSHANHDVSPYMSHVGRMQNMDMGIDSLIHRGPGGGSRGI